jgi:hypothetical protein
MLCAKLEENINTSFSNISDDDLDQIIKSYCNSHPNYGIRYLHMHLRSQGLRIQHHHLEQSITRVDQLGQTLRCCTNAKKQQTQYHISCLNALWHINGHHKLIHWGIIIHGVVDGYSRKVYSLFLMVEHIPTHLHYKVTGLCASTDNHAPTVLDMFIDAIIEHGVPSRVCGDHGGENQDISILMIILWGLDRASLMWDSSIFNTRIERLWVEVGCQFAWEW